MAAHQAAVNLQNSEYRWVYIDPPVLLNEFGKNIVFNLIAKKSRLLLLIEHLDAIVYAIEGLEEQIFAVQPPPADASADDILDYQYELRQFVEIIRARELSLIAHVQRARLQAKKMSRFDTNIRVFARLFNAGTQTFADQILQLGKPIESDFDGNDQVLNFLISRRLIASDCLSTEETGKITLINDYRISGLVLMSMLKNQCESFLDLIENHKLVAELSDVKTGQEDKLHRLQDAQNKNLITT